MAAYTTIDDAGAFFNPILYTGTGSSLALTGVGFQPDFTWIKNRDAADFYVLTDAVRGVTKYIESNDSVAQVTNVESLKSFDADGFTVGTQAEVNTNTEKYVSWNWKAGTTSGISGGDITPSAYSINTTSGFGVYLYTGNGSSTQTIAHGLGVVPTLVMVESTTLVENWAVYHQSTGNTIRMTLNTGGTTSVNTDTWQDTTPTSTVFTIGSNSRVNTNTETYVAYVFADVSGYSKMGSYSGNGNADGPFVYTGFRPAFLMLKDSQTSAAWRMFDDKREGFNVENDDLEANTTAVEGTDANLDILSNGFKIRRSVGGLNTAGYKNLYMAFAEFPIVSSNDVPVVAR